MNSQENHAQVSDVCRKAETPSHHRPSSPTDFLSGWQVLGRVNVRIPWRRLTPDGQIASGLYPSTVPFPAMSIDFFIAARAACHLPGTTIMLKTVTSTDRRTTHAEHLNNMSQIEISEHLGATDPGLFTDVRGFSGKQTTIACEGQTANVLELTNHVKSGPITQHCLGLRLTDARLMLSRFWGLCIYHA